MTKMSYKKVLQVEGKCQMEYLKCETKWWATYYKYEGVADAWYVLKPHPHTSSETSG